MKKKMLACVFLCFFFIILPGCSKKAAPKAPLCRVVTQVDIAGQEKDVQIYRHYTDEQKAQWVLIYLRTLKPSIRPQSPPENSKNSRYEITLTFSDGKQKVFRQAAHRYYAVEDRPWHAIDPAQASGLYALLRALPSDL